jgi:hypothetical protein
LPWHHSRFTNTKYAGLHLRIACHNTQSQGLCSI